MINKKTIPDWWYAAATSACTVAAFVILWPRHMDTNAITVLLGTVGIAAALSIVTGIYIKKNINVDSRFLDLIEVSAIPVYVYLSLRQVGYSKCLKCVSIVIIVWLFYTAILIKVNVANHQKYENRKYLKKVIATGLYNIRFIVLMALVAQMLFTHQNFEKDHKYYLQYADMRNCLCVEEEYFDCSDPIAAIERDWHDTQTT